MAACLLLFAVLGCAMSARANANVLITGSGGLALDLYVVDQEGDGVPDAYVDILQGERAVGKGVTDTNGGLHVSRIASGQGYRVQVRSSICGNKTVDYKAPKEGAASLRIQLPGSLPAVATRSLWNLLQSPRNMLLFILFLLFLALALLLLILYILWRKKKKADEEQHALQDTQGGQDLYHTQLIASQDDKEPLNDEKQD